MLSHSVTQSLSHSVTGISGYWWVQPRVAQPIGPAVLFYHANLNKNMATNYKFL